MAEVDQPHEQDGQREFDIPTADANNPAGVTQDVQGYLRSHGDTDGILMDQNALLELDDVSMNFSGITALESVDLAVAPGEVTCLLGDNGAGKSTLIKIMSGVHLCSAATMGLCPAAGVTSAGSARGWRGWVRIRSSRSVCLSQVLSGGPTGGVLLRPATADQLPGLTLIDIAADRT